MKHRYILPTLRAHLWNILLKINFRPLFFAQQNVDSPTDLRSNSNNETLAKNNAASNETIPEHCAFIPESEPKNANFVLIYILICIYSFLAVTVTCHNYFVTSLSRICDRKI